MFPESPLTYVRLGSLLAKQGDFNAAIAALGQSVEHDPHAGQTDLGPALELAEQGRTQEALARFRACFDVASELGGAQMELATTLARRREDAETLARLRHQIARDPDSEAPYLALAELLRRQGKFREADRYDAQSVQACLRTVEKMIARGRELAELGRLDEAIEHFQAAIEQSGGCASAYAHLADVLARQGDKDGAIEHYRSALQLDPQCETAQAALARLAP